MFAVASARAAPPPLAPARVASRVVGPSRARGASWRRARASPADEIETTESEAPGISAAMANARACEDEGMSPGAGLLDAEAQAEAAFADMINTTVDVTGEALEEGEREALARGGRMDDESTSKKSGTILDDVRDLFGALSKGAHIVRQKNGRV